ncbi:HEAT repeat domain-containing protein [Nocardioides terrisoli]|uniref:HEAT repeat domain-containing protein n=1 Tax=Nocardioides terrisoli TaxID=3388267 RepID=UPI00287BC126|nr:HEAT repeat domain-containing protein [Nocardioides marmorisolisilvae]
MPVDPGLLQVATVLLSVFAGVAGLVFVVLLALRLGVMTIDRRTDRRRAADREVIFDLLMGEPEEAEAARADLLGRGGRAWDHTEDLVYEMLPKLKGDSRGRLVEVLAIRGAVRRARRLSHSVSAVRRCRGAFALGVLGDVESQSRLVELLGDRHFLVRRTAVRALGNLGDPGGAAPLLELIGDEPRLSRDLTYALHRIGPGAGPLLRAEVASGLEHPEDRHLHADLAATVLGLLGDVAAGSVLTRGVSSPRLGFGLACAEALGRIGSPDAIPSLTATLDDPRPPIRVAAAQALGLLGSDAAVARLLEVVEEDDPGVSRQAADALRALGPAGVEVLRGSLSSYAVEAVALADLKASR